LRMSTPSPSPAIDMIVSQLAIAAIGPASLAERDQ
jgi:hypothetical protein